MSQTGISYLDATWNPVVGCTPESEGCDNCWARNLHNRRNASRVWEGRPEQYDVPFNFVQCLDARLDQPLHWRKPRRIGVCFVGDLFHEDVPDAFIVKVLNTAFARAPQHQYFFLTKRATRLHHILSAVWLDSFGDTLADKSDRLWFGVTAENQTRAAARIPLLLQTPAAHRWVSLEPLLGPVNICAVPDGKTRPAEFSARYTPLGDLDWVVCGGESGKDARPCDVAWIRSIVRQCRNASVPCYVKQLGATPIWDLDESVRFLRDRAGADPSEWPEDLRVREVSA